MHIHTAKTLQWQTIKDKLRQYTLSPLGKKEVSNLKCFNDPVDIKARLLETHEMSQILKETLFPDVEIHNINSELDQCKVENSFLYTDELVRVAQTLKASRLIKQFLLPFKERCPYLFNIFTDIDTFKHLEDSIFKSIDAYGKLVDSASPELKSIRNDIRRKKVSIEKRLNQVIKDHDNVHLIQDAIVTLRENRYVIPIKRDHKGKLKGIVLDTSGSGETLFLEPEGVVEENNSLIALFKDEKDEEVRILKRLTRTIREKLESIRISLKKLAMIDLLYAKAIMALKMNGVMPELNDQGIFKLFSARHPLLKGDIIPVDLFLGENSDILIITGPNTGGKTVALKTLGLVTMMAMAGLLIPVKEGSIISTVDSIFIDSGDEQSIEQNLSTFSGHIKRIIHILDNATEKSLVLIDEIGAGTDPEEGSSLGIAIIDQLRQVGCRAVITTHYTKIKNYPLFYNRIQNASCQFDLETLRPAYRLIYGVSGKSMALEIAGRLGLKDSIIEKAGQIIEEDSSPEDRFLQTVHDEKDRIAELSETYHTKLNRISLKESELKVREDILKKEMKEFKKLKLSKELDSISETRKKILKLYDDLKSSPLEKVKLTQAIKEVDYVKETINLDLDEMEEEKPYFDPDHEWQIGESAYLKSLNKVGKITAMSKSNITIQVGDIKVKTDIADLQLPSSGMIEKTKPKKDGYVTLDVVGETPPYELLLLGFRGEEAVRETEKYIETLYTNGMAKGRIVHGKGGGILRSLIEEMLKSHPYIKSYQLAKPEHGGYGVTEIVIK